MYSLHICIFFFAEIKTALKPSPTHTHLPHSVYLVKRIVICRGFVFSNCRNESISVKNLFLITLMIYKERFAETLYSLEQFH